MAQYYDRPGVIYTEVMKIVANMLKIDKPVSSALDVACGTGVSTLPLKLYAKSIIGVDASKHMLQQANRENRDKQIEYKLAAAEFLPFVDKSFDLAVIFAGFQFVDQTQFLKEAARVLRDNSHLVICHPELRGIETPEFENWLQNRFYQKYPSLSDKREYSTKEHGSGDFPHTQVVRYPETIRTDIHGIIQLLMTTSGVFHAVEKKSESRQAIQSWLSHELQPFFSGQEKMNFKFDLSVWCLKRAPRPVLHNSNPYIEEGMLVRCR